MESTRECTKCGIEKPLSEFYRQSGRDTYKRQCKSCEAARQAQWACKHPDLVKENKRRFRESHRDEILAYRQANAAHLRELKTLWVENHRDQVNALQKRWREEHPDRQAAYNLVKKALREGVLVRQPCSLCGDMDSHAHHDDYSKPLDVVWFCRSCHTEYHAQERKGISFKP